MTLAPPRTEKSCAKTRLPRHADELRNDVGIVLLPRGRQLSQKGFVGDAGGRGSTAPFQSFLLDEVNEGKELRMHAAERVDDKGKECCIRCSRVRLIFALLGSSTALELLTRIRSVAEMGGRAGVCATQISKDRDMSEVELTIRDEALGFRLQAREHTARAGIVANLVHGLVVAAGHFFALEGGASNGVPRIV